MSWHPVHTQNDINIWRFKGYQRCKENKSVDLDFISMAYSRSLPFGSRSLNYHRGWHITECDVMQTSIIFRYKRMRGSCIEKNRCRVAINKKRTENDVGILLSFFGRDTVDMATWSGDRFGVEYFPCRLATANNFSRLVGVGLGTCLLYTSDAADE